MSPKEYRQRWLAALRSGDHKQTTRVLTHVVETGVGTELRHCCLGVACHLFHNDCGLDPAAFIDSDGNSCRRYQDANDNGSYTSLPSSVSVLLGVKRGAEVFIPVTEEMTEIPISIIQNSALSGLGRYTTLAALNDYGWTFDQIADFIDKYEDQLFHD